MYSNWWVAINKPVSVKITSYGYESFHCNVKSERCLPEETRGRVWRRTRQWCVNTPTALAKQSVLPSYSRITHPTTTDCLQHKANGPIQRLLPWVLAGWQRKQQPKCIKHSMYTLMKLICDTIWTCSISNPSSTDAFYKVDVRARGKLKEPVNAIIHRSLATRACSCSCDPQSGLLWNTCLIPSS